MKSIQELQDDVWDKLNDHCKYRPNSRTFDYKVHRMSNRHTVHVVEYLRSLQGVGDCQVYGYDEFNIIRVTINGKIERQEE